MPPVVFTGLSIYNRPVSIGSEDSPLEKSISVVDRLDLSASQSTFSISLSPMNFRSPRPIQLSYMLDGYDSEWYPVMDNTISYTRLAPGVYCLKIRGNNGTVPVKELEIRVHPPFYYSVWAFIIYAIIATAAVFYAVMRFRRKQRQDRDRMEQDKIRELYVAKFNFFTNIAHEIRTPLSLISGPVESLKRNLGRTDNPEVDEDLDMISRNTGRLMELINQLLDFRKVETSNYEISLQSGDLSATVETAGKVFFETKTNPSVKFRMNIAKGVFGVFDPEIVTVILNNLLSNAFKFTPSGVICLNLYPVTVNGVQSAEIIVSDTGYGIAKEQIPKIFERYYQVKDGRCVQGTGIGLSLVKSLVSLHGGTIEVESEVGRGSNFRVVLPLESVETAAARPAETQRGGGRCD